MICLTFQSSSTTGMFRHSSMSQIVLNLAASNQIHRKRRLLDIFQTAKIMRDLSMWDSQKKIMPTTEKCKNSFLEWKQLTNSLPETVKRYKICTLKKLIHFTKWGTSLLNSMRAPDKFWTSFPNQQDSKSSIKSSSHPTTWWLNGVMSWGISTSFYKKISILFSSTSETSCTVILKSSKNKKLLKISLSKPN